MKNEEILNYVMYANTLLDNMYNLYETPTTEQMLAVKRMGTNLGHILIELDDKIKEWKYEREQLNDKIEELEEQIEEKEDYIEGLEEELDDLKEDLVKIQEEKEILNNLEKAITVSKELILKGGTKNEK